MFRSTRRLVIAAILLIAWHPDLAESQIGRRPVARRTAVNWLGASVGIVQAYGLSDGVTSSTWQFGSGLDYAGRVLHQLQSGILVGAHGSWSRASLQYEGTGCTAGCDATATVMQMLGVARYEQGTGFHSVYELTAGAIGYSHFRETSTNTPPAPRDTDYDLRFALGYGFALSFSPSASVELVQEVGTILHQKTGLSGSSSNYPRVYVTRIGGKIAF